MTRDLEAALREARGLLLSIRDDILSGYDLDAIVRKIDDRLPPRIDADMSAASGEASGDSWNINPTCDYPDCVCPEPKATHCRNSRPAPATTQLKMVEELEGNLAICRQVAVDRADTILALRARLETAKEALKPFADVAEKFPLPKEDVRPLFAFNGVELTYGDFRRARAAIAEMEKET